jgi:hypothetical protein
MTLDQWSKNAWMSPGPKRSQIACKAATSAQEANPLARAVKAIPALAAWRLAHSWPLHHYAAAPIMWPCLAPWLVEGVDEPMGYA